jgi:hypothetical protein
MKSCRGSPALSTFTHNRQRGSPPLSTFSPPLSRTRLTVQGIPSTVNFFPSTVNIALTVWRGSPPLFNLHYQLSRDRRNFFSDGSRDLQNFCMAAVYPPLLDHVKAKYIHPPFFLSPPDVDTCRGVDRSHMMPPLRRNKEQITGIQVAFHPRWCFFEE